MRKLLATSAAALAASAGLLWHSNQQVQTLVAQQETLRASPQPLFSDGFEDGTLLAWSSVVPKPPVLMTIPGGAQATMDWSMLCPHGPGMYVVQATITNSAGDYTVATVVTFTEEMCLECCSEEDCYG